MAKYAFALAQGVQRFYHETNLTEERDDVRRWRAAAGIYVRTRSPGPRPDGLDVPRGCDDEIA